MSEGLTAYFSSVSSNMKIKKNQQHIQMILSSKKVQFEIVDVSKDPETLQKMRKLSGNTTALPPQLFKGDKYLGDYEAFFEAVESETLDTFIEG
uniref:SH3 domain-binding glutamic acid-rich-like protein 3 n=1 Tax=Phallusia mammillata TaxID=59560 RepID=A0A6F9DS93_9ASCI|nr:SH3 domain-binding glutamic acid-rich-like protein 3 [Phallusia mammillata]